MASLFTLITTTIIVKQYLQLIVITAEIKK